MKKHIVCLGDSNTHGYCADPADCIDGGGRYNEAERWTCRLQKALGEDYLVVEEGLCGRTAVFPDPLNEGMSGLDYLYPCLKSHEPVSLLVVMLGTNDTKERYGASAGVIANGVKRLILKAKGTDCWGGKAPNILLVAPPPIGDEMERTDVVQDMGHGCGAKSRALAGYFAETAALTGASFLDGAPCDFNKTDFMHLTAKGHAQMSALLTERVRALTADEE
ncbi:MAG: GDSL-type esterase/lipase family protein [Oscillospiraceae bacterium]